MQKLLGIPKSLGRAYIFKRFLPSSATSKDMVQTLLYRTMLKVKANMIQIKHKCILLNLISHSIIFQGREGMTKFTSINWRPVPRILAVMVLYLLVNGDSKHSL